MDFWVDVGLFVGYFHSSFYFSVSIIAWKEVRHSLLHELFGGLKNLCMCIIIMCDRILIIITKLFRGSLRGYITHCNRNKVVALQKWLTTTINIFKLFIYKIVLYINNHGLICKIIPIFQIFHYILLYYNQSIVLLAYNLQ